MKDTQTVYHCSMCGNHADKSPLALLVHDLLVLCDYNEAKAYHDYIENEPHGEDFDDGDFDAVDEEARGSAVHIYGTICRLRKAAKDLREALL